MKTYIRKNIDGYYIDFPEELDNILWEGKIGETYQDFLEGKWVLLTDEQVSFHEEHPEATVLEVFNMEIEEPVRTIEEVKAEKLEEIKQYDESDSVNCFYVSSNGNTISAWLTPAERANYRSSIDAAELVGVDNLSLYIGELPITLPISTAKLMLAQILLYADQCFIVTKLHEDIIKSMDSIEAIYDYDITLGYPNKLTFTT